MNLTGQTKLERTNVGRPKKQLMHFTEKYRVRSKHEPNLDKIQLIYHALAAATYYTFHKNLIDSKSNTRTHTVR